MTLRPPADSARAIQAHLINWEHAQILRIR